MTKLLDDRLPDPPLLTEFPFNFAAKRLARGDIRATAAQRAAYLRYTQIGDPLADAVAEMFRRLPPKQGRQMFELAVEQGIDAVTDPPPELVAFFASVDPVPIWLDQHKLHLACQVIARTGVVAGFTSLAMLALTGGYLAGRVVKALTATGDLERMAPRRIAETTAWHSAVTSPGGLDRFAEGFKATLRVRLMHSLVRVGLARRPDWRADLWDHPLNQGQLCGTIMLFSLAHLSGSQAMGLHFSAPERDAVYHLWRYVGLLMGCDPHLLPTNEFDAWKLFWLEADYEFRSPDNDSIRLAQALLHAVGPLVAGDGTALLDRAKRYAATEFMAAYGRLVLGKRNADFLRLPDRKPFQAIVIATSTIIRASEIPRRVIPGATRWRETRGRRSKATLTETMMAVHRGDATYGRHDARFSAGRTGPALTSASGRC